MHRNDISAANDIFRTKFAEKNSFQCRNKILEEILLEYAYGLYNQYDEKQYDDQYDRLPEIRNNPNFRNLISVTIRKIAGIGLPFQFRIYLKNGKQNIQNLKLKVRMSPNYAF